MKLHSVNEWLTLGANLGVLAGIVFLGLEIRQNSEALLAGSRQDLLAAVLVILDNMIDYPQLYNPANTGNLTGDDIPRRDAYFVSILRIREFAWQQYRNGLVDEQTLASYLEPLRFVFDSDEGRAFLLSRQYSGDPEFDEFVIGYLELSDAGNRAAPSDSIRDQE
jgi:hypothetical protein